MNAHTIAAAVSAAAVLVLGACGGSSGGSGGMTAAAGGGPVSVRSVEGVGNVLVDADGSALYFADQETDGMIACTGGCTKVWLPLTLPAGTDVGSGGDLAGMLGTIARPDGGRQVTWNGKPLYRFAEDGGPGTVSGDGAADSFGGTSFTWHVARTGTSSGSGGSPTTTQPGGGSSY